MAARQFPGPILNKELWFGTLRWTTFYEHNGEVRHILENFQVRSHNYFVN